MPRNHILVPFKETGHAHQHCLESALSAAEKTCQLRGVRLTNIRRRVLELIWSSHEPVKAYDILDQLRDDHAGSAPPTVYRALDFLQAEGMVHKIESLNAYVGCGDPNLSHTGQFLICRECGAVAEMDDKEVRKVLAEKAALLGFKIDSEMIEMKGLCAICASVNS
jgi:Fur family zinc uptake transcriptional regulator